MRLIVNVIISWNVFSLYVIEQIWSKGTSESRKTTISLTLLLVTGISLHISISDIWESYNWKAAFFSIYLVQIFISIIFREKISNVVANFSQSCFRGYFWIYIIYLVTTFLLFFYQIYHYYYAPLA